MRVAIAACLVVCACANNVRQDKATTVDGRIKGATSIELENGAGQVTDIVTYPGGDRVDWKKLELPEKQRGPLDIKMTWTTPRPGLRLAFDVFDAYNRQVASSRKVNRLARAASIKDAKGTYFIRVYAVGRGDAGRYKLGVEFDGTEVGTQKPIEVSDPPKLADLPDISLQAKCDLYKFDFSLPDCQDKCPQVNPPATWPGCAKTCTVNPPNADMPACAATMACPKGGDIRVKRCTEADFPPCPDPKNPDLNNLRCVNFRYRPEVARITGKSVIGGEVEIIIPVGLTSNIEKTWSGVVLNGKSDKPLAGGRITITRVDGGVVFGRVRLTAEQVQANPTVVFAPPPKTK